MAEITVATWGKDLAFGVLQDMGREAGLIDGDQVNSEILKGEIVISKRLPPSRRASRPAPAERWKGSPPTARAGPWMGFRSAY
ncbi:hypothetical protein [Caulobacter sp. DWP3-1-3b2]|uniref:hypothetical protein n=1 Tax=Caulobacter sp. DWP3-1-3b2 TaxID=2804643 RepID=UPI003CFB8D34